MEQTPVIKVRNLTFHYPNSEQQVLQQISFDVYAGEVIGIVGASGAGKTTLCLCLKGIIPHLLHGMLSGDVWIMDKNTKSVPIETLAQEIGMVFQDPESQIIGMTVMEDLAFGPENLERPPAEILSKIEPLLSKVNLQGFSLRETYRLSGGQKQRLAIASALIMESKLLILDEPTSELDPIGREEIYNTIGELKASGVTVVVVDHAIEEMSAICDRLLVMDNGRVIYDDTPRNHFGNAGHLLHNDFIRVPQASEALYELAKQGYVAPQLITPYEDEAVEALQKLLGKVEL